MVTLVTVMKSVPKKMPFTPSILNNDLKIQTMYDNLIIQIIITNIALKSSRSSKLVKLETETFH